MKNAKIPIIVEKNYQKSVWCAKILEGIGRQKYTIVNSDKLEALAANFVIPIIGTTNHFLTESIAACTKHNLRPIVVGTEITDIDSRISSIKTNRKAAIAGLVKYYKSLSRDRIALLGINKYSSIDMEKRDAFAEIFRNLYDKDVSENIYYNKTTAGECIDALFKNISSYNGVICSNDYFAVAFISSASQRGIKIPEDVFVAGNGNSFIGENISPSITSVAPKYYEMGVQTRKAYHYLTDNPTVSSLNILVDYDIIVRDSTDNEAFSREHHSDTKSFEPCTHTIFDDDKIKKIIGLDAIFGASDSSLIMILKGILNDVSYSALAEKLYLSDSAFRYKLNKIFTLTHTQSKNELKELLKTLNLKDDK